MSLILICIIIHPHYYYYTLLLLLLLLLLLWLISSNIGIGKIPEQEVLHHGNKQLQKILYQIL